MDCPAFLKSGRTAQASTHEWDGDADRMWRSPLQDIWDVLGRTHGALGDVAAIHRGIEWNVPLKKRRDELISNAEPDGQGFKRGMDTVPNCLSRAFAIDDCVWLNTDPRLMRGNSYKLPWHERKVIVNAATVSRGPWRLLAAADLGGLVCYQNFHGIWPSGKMPTTCLAAVINSPVVNAYVHGHEGKRHNKRCTLASAPVPDLSYADMQTLDGLVSEYMALQVSSLEKLGGGEAERRLRACLQQIDALVLKGYDLPPRMERKLLDLFRGHRRPVPFDFDRFYPDDFRPSIPYHEYVSPGFREAGASETLERLPAVDDEAIHEAVVALAAGDSVAVGD